MCMIAVRWSVSVESGLGMKLNARFGNMESEERIERSGVMHPRMYKYEQLLCKGCARISRQMETHLGPVNWRWGCAVVGMAGRKCLLDFRGENVHEDAVLGGLLEHAWGGKEERRGSSSETTCREAEGGELEEDEVASGRRGARGWLVNERGSFMKKWLTLCLDLKERLSVGVGVGIMGGPASKLVGLERSLVSLGAKCWVKRLVVGAWLASVECVMIECWIGSWMLAKDLGCCRCVLRRTGMGGMYVGVREEGIKKAVAESLGDLLADLLGSCGEFESLLSLKLIMAMAAVSCSMDQFSRLDKSDLKYLKDMIGSVENKVDKCLWTREGETWENENWLELESWWTSEIKLGELALWEWLNAVTYMIEGWTDVC
ncbi:hypothetical protein Tco_0085126 [Tanacetum coccineum]